MQSHSDPICSSTTIPWSLLSSIPTSYQQSQSHISIEVVWPTSFCTSIPWNHLLPRGSRNGIYPFEYESIKDKRYIAHDVYGTRHSLDNPRLGQVRQATRIKVIHRNGTGLLRTCKLVHMKATEILYGANTFAFAEMMHPVRANGNLVSPCQREILRCLGRMLVVTRLK